MRGQLGQGAAGEWEEEAKKGGREVSTALWSWMVLRVCLVRLGLACLLACWGGINVSLWWGGVWGVVWLGCGTGYAGRHGGAPARPYVGASHTPDDDLA